MGDGVVDAAAAKGNGLHHTALELPVTAEQVQRQRTGPGENISQCLMDVVIGHNGEQRPEDLLGHQRALVVQGGLDQGRLNLERFPDVYKRQGPDLCLRPDRV